MMAIFCITMLKIESSADQVPVGTEDMTRTPN